MKPGCSAEAQQVRNLRARIGPEIIAVPQLVMRSEKPARIRFNTLERADVILQINMPAGRVGILLPFRPGRHWIQVRSFPETLRQRRKTKTRIELLGR